MACFFKVRLPTTRQKLSINLIIRITVAQLRQLKNPAKKNLSILREWLGDPKGGNGFLRDSEFFTWEPQYDGDFVTFGAAKGEQDIFTIWFTSAFAKLYHSLWGHKRNGKVVIDEESGMVEYRDEYFDKFATAFSTTIASLLPVLAVLGLYFEKGLLKRIYIMIVMTAVFAAVLSLCSKARRIEIFAATAT